jgi:hypothetical protein
MSRRTLNGSHALGGRPAILALFILAAALLLTPFIVIGGGGNESPRLTIQLPRGLAVKSSLHGKRLLQGNLPAGGRYVWCVVGGKGCAPYEIYCAKNGGKWLSNSLLLDAVLGPQEEQNDIPVAVPSA